MLKKIINKLFNSQTKTKNFEKYNLKYIQQITQVSEFFATQIITQIENELKKTKINHQILENSIAKILSHSQDTYLLNIFSQIIDNPYKLSEHTDKLNNFNFQKLKDIDVIEESTFKYLNSAGADPKNLTKQELNLLYIIQLIFIGLIDSALLTFKIFCLQKECENHQIKLNSKSILLKIGTNNMQDLRTIDKQVSNKYITLNKKIKILTQLQPNKEKNVGCSFVLYSPKLTKKYIEILLEFYEKIYKIKNKNLNPTFELNPIKFEYIYFKHQIEE